MRNDALPVLMCLPEGEPMTRRCESACGSFARASAARFAVERQSAAAAGRREGSVRGGNGP